MPVTHVGGPTVWGCAAWTITVGSGAGTVVSGAILSSQDVSSDAKEVMHVDGTTGGTRGITFFDTGKTVQVECYVQRDTVNNAIASKNLLPTKGTRVVITAAAPDASDRIVGTYICMASSQRRSNSDKFIATLTLQQWDEITDNTPVAG